MSETMHDPSFAKMGKAYQEKVMTAVLTDHQFAEQMMDILKPTFFDLKYLTVVAEKFYEHKRKFKTYPSIELVGIMATKGDEAEKVVGEQVNEYLARVISDPLNGDRGFIEESSLDFCKKQNMKEAMSIAIDRIEDSKYDDIQTIMREALQKGTSPDYGHEYSEQFEARAQKSHRKPIKTGWEVMDRALNGGWERQTLTTFIAPTGAGKSMFLVNCGAAAIQNGLNVAYVTCEMADYKIGMRFDSYYSGIEINKINERPDHVESVVREKIKGRLFIKEFPTKTATVQTIRSYLQRLYSTKGFMPDMVIVDYADLLRGTRNYGEKRHELEGVYEELRALAQELNVVLITADQTNRAGLNEEVVTLSSIAESYAKATVCDLIVTISRRPEDKVANAGRIFIAKSRLGQDGVIFPFTLNTATVRVNVLDRGVDPVAMALENQQNLQAKLGARFQELRDKERLAAGHERV